MMVGILVRSDANINTKCNHKVKEFHWKADSMQNQVPFLWLRYVRVSCSTWNLLLFQIKTISPRFF